MKQKEWGSMADLVGSLGKRFKEFRLEYNKQYYTGSDCGIGNIENGPEKDKILASEKGEPFWIISLDQWKV